MQQAQLHVLVVEDEVVNRDVVCQILQYFGHEVDAVDSGLAALRAIRAVPYDVVVMDCRMHDMDGLETTRRLRAGEGGPDGVHIPIIALTAQAFAADRDACLSVGMNDFLTKPVDIDHLALALTRWGRRPRQGAHAARGREAVAADARARHGDAAVFDASVLAALPMVADGSQPHYGEVVLDLYFKSLPDLLKTIAVAVAGGDDQTVQRTAHSLKSSSAAVGAMAMAACAAEAESQLRKGYPDMSHLPSRFDMEYERLCTMLGRSQAHLPESAV
ncbi:MAG: response regulator [Aquabacterium sp.]|nr:response regulator [Aquabacterium sp.]